MQQAIMYRRVSTQEQGRSGLGLAAQEEAIKRFCEMEGFEVVGEFYDIQTGKGSDALDKRPNFSAAVKMARRLKCPLVAQKIDRLARDTGLICSLMDSGLDFIVAELGVSGSKDKLNVQLRAVIAEDEARKISERTRAALAVKRVELATIGKRLGNTKNLTEAQAKGQAANKAAAAAFAKRMLPVIGKLADSGMSANAIANHLNQMRLPTMRDGKWTAKAVGRVLIHAA